MEIRVYLRLLQKRWWLVLALFTITMAATAYFTLNTKPVYQAKASYIVRLSPSAEERNIISALNTLTSRTEIAATYASVASSSLIQNKAADALGISHNNNLSVRSQLKSGTNILEITVQGNNPALVRDYTNAIGTQTVNYVESLYETYRLELLDEAALPGSPIKPNLPQNLTLGGILGLMLGIGLVIFAEYLKTPSESSAIYNILDEHIGIYDMRYFRERLHQEMSRIRRHKGILSLALVNIDHRRLLSSVSPQIRLEAMRNVVMAVGKNLRDEDVMASFSDTELAILLPELDGEHAKIAIERTMTIINKVSVELSMSGRNVNLNGAAGIAPLYSGDRATTDVLIGRAQYVLESMRESTYGKVIISTEKPVTNIPEQKETESQEVKSASVEKERSGISEKQGLSATKNVAAQDQPEISEQVETVPAEESANQPHHGKKPHHSGGKKNENGRKRLELSEQES